MHCTAPSKLFGISSTPRHGTKPLRHSIGLTIGRAKPFPCFCTSYGGCPLMLHLLSDWEYPHLDDDGRGHHCGARVYGFCILSKQERAGQRVEPGTGSHPNRTAKGYAGIRIGWRPVEGEGEMTDEDETESTNPGIILLTPPPLKLFCPPTPNHPP